MCSSDLCIKNTWINSNGFSLSTITKSIVVKLILWYIDKRIGLFGYIGALSMKSDYTEMMETVILPELGMTNT